MLLFTQRQTCFTNPIKFGGGGWRDYGAGLMTDYRHQLGFQPLIQTETWLALNLYNQNSKKKNLPAEDMRYIILASIQFDLLPVTRSSVFFCWMRKKMVQVGHDPSHVHGQKKKESLHILLTTFLSFSLSLLFDAIFFLCPSLYSSHPKA